jgi:hypothetical protein
MAVLKTSKEILVTTLDILKGLNATVWGGPEKVGKVVTTGLTCADVGIGT